MMSRTTLYRIDADGTLEPFEEFRNAFRSAMFVWGDFAVRYGIMPREETHRILTDMGVARRVWGLYKDPRVPRHERIVMLSTHDRALCRAADFPELIAAMRQYHRERA